MQSLAALTIRSTRCMAPRDRRRQTRARFLVETLEDRAMPTVVFPAATFGAETTTDGGG
ncbi:MAG: hypothetical protein ACLQGP_36395 [Isosphaeraceae bacterium]